MLHKKALSWKMTFLRLTFFKKEKIGCLERRTQSKTGWPEVTRPRSTEKNGANKHWANKKCLQLYIIPLLKYTRVSNKKLLYGSVWLLLSKEISDLVGRRTLNASQMGSDTHHAVDLRLASLGQVYNIDPIVVEILHAAVKVLPQESPRLSGQRDPAETQLLEKKQRRQVVSNRRQTLTNRMDSFEVVNLIVLPRVPPIQCITKVFHQHHWLTLKRRIDCEILLLIFTALHNVTSPLTLYLHLGCLVLHTSISIWQLANVERVSRCNICMSHAERETLGKFAY